MHKERFIALAQAVGKSEDAARVLPMLERNMKQFVDYVRAVFMLEVSIQIINARVFDSREAAEKIAEKDRARRVAHESAIAAVSACNRIAERYGAEPVFDGDISDRYEVADFCGLIVEEIYGSVTGADYSTKPILDKLLEL